MMKKLIGCLAILCVLTSCNVTETIVFSEDGSGEFLVSYDMGKIMSEMKSLGGEMNDENEKKPQKSIDTTMVFAELMKTYKDSILELPKDKQDVFEAVKDMYMTMQMDDEAGKMNMGIGMKFKSIEDLKGIQEKLKKAQSLNAQSSQADMMKDSSPLGKLSGDNNGKVAYNYNASGFSRLTTLPEMTEEESEVLESLLNGEEESSEEITDYFKDSFYVVKLVFPKPVKSVDTEGATLSADRKTVTYKTNWMDYIKNPQSLDVNVTFYE